jgi:cyclopropane fatty-acyl-phospholipid synthase-like methyltransferase
MMDIKTIKDQLRKAYDKDAERRSGTKKTREDWKLKIRQQFIDLLKAENKASVLELGAGTGFYSLFFKENGFKVLATDLSQGMVNKCKELGLEAQILDLYDVSTLTDNFDSIFSMSVLMHVPKQDLPVVLKNLASKLNSGGVLFIGLYGGVDTVEIKVDKDKVDLPRYMSFLSDETLLEVVKDIFTVISFEAIDIQAKTPGFHYQSLFLRKDKN